MCCIHILSGSSGLGDNILKVLEENVLLAFSICISVHNKTKQV